MGVQDLLQDQSHSPRPAQGVLFRDDAEQEQLGSAFLGHRHWLRAFLAQLVPHTAQVGCEPIMGSR